MDGSFDQFVDKQKRDGACHGEGEFTLDLIAARAKLGRHQLPESWAYILKLVQWAVASNPTEIRIEVRRRFVSVSHDGNSTDFAVLKNAFQRSDKGSVRHLVSALSAVSELTPGRLVLRSATDFVVLAGDSEKTVGDLSEEVYLSRLPRRLGIRSSLLLDYSSQFVRSTDAQGPLAKLLWDSTGVNRPEYGLVRQLCFLGDVPISLNGKWINRPLLGLPNRVVGTEPPLDLTPGADKGAYRARVLLKSERKGPGGLAAPMARFGAAHTDWVETEPGQTDGEVVGHVARQIAGSFWAIALTAGITSRLLATTGRVEVIEAAARPQATVPGFTFRGQPFRSAWAVYLRYPLGYALGEGRILWLLDGVVITHQIWKELPHSHIVFADAEGLHTDISGFQLIEDEAYAERMNWLRHWLPEA